MCKMVKNLGLQVTSEGGGQLKEYITSHMTFKNAWENGLKTITLTKI